MRCVGIEAAFLADILSHPHEDAPRMAYADWLSENGQPCRAEFIQAQLELHWNATPGHPLRPPPSEANDRRQDYLSARLKVLSLRNTPEVVNGIHGKRSRERNGQLEHQPYCWLRPNGVAMDWCVFRRGFVAEAECLYQTWLAWGPGLLTDHPIELVSILDIEPTRSLMEGIKRFGYSDHPLDADYFYRHHIDRDIGKYMPPGPWGYSGDGGGWHRYESEKAAKLALSQGLLGWAREKNSATSLSR